MRGLNSWLPNFALDQSNIVTGISVFLSFSALIENLLPHYYTGVKTKAFKLVVSVKNVPSGEISDFRLLFKTSGESKSANPTHEPLTVANVNLSVNLVAFHSSAVANFSEQPNGANSYALALNQKQGL